MKGKFMNKGDLIQELSKRKNKGSKFTTKIKNYFLKNTGFNLFIFFSISEILQLKGFEVFFLRGGRDDPVFPRHTIRDIYRGVRWYFSYRFITDRKIPITSKDSPAFPPY
jgi:hypothetical protein